VAALTGMAPDTTPLSPEVPFESTTPPPDRTLRASETLSQRRRGDKTGASGHEPHAP
jgi:hypothetical protein